MSYLSCNQVTIVFMLLLGNVDILCGLLSFRNFVAGYMGCCACLFHTLMPCYHITAWQMLFVYMKSMKICAVISVVQKVVVGQKRVYSVLLRLCNLCSYSHACADWVQTSVDHGHQAKIKHNASSLELSVWSLWAIGSKHSQSEDGAEWRWSCVDSLGEGLGVRCTLGSHGTVEPSASPSPAAVASASAAASEAQ